MQVFHFILDHRVGGPHAYVRSITKTLPPVIASTVVTTGRGDATDMALTNLRHRFRLLYPFEVVCNVLRLCWHFRRRASRRNVIFDVHGAANVAPILAARLMNVPVVWHFHETATGFRTLVRLGKRVLRGARHKCVAVAKKAAQVFELSEVEVIPGVIDPNFWRFSEARRSPCAPGRPLRLAAIGNLNPLKGIDLLLEALAGLDCAWELTVVGAELSTYREYAAELYEKGRALATRGKVQFLGWRSPDEVRNILSSSDIFVLPSRSEACPLALLEAMAMECVCIATDVGDVREILNGPELGVVTATDSREELRAALDQVGRMTPVGRSEMGERARRRVIAHYSPGGIGERHLEIYRALVGESVRS